MTRRQLSKIEKELNSKAIKRFTERNDKLKEYYIPKTELEINVGLKISYNKTKEELSQAVKEWKNEVESNNKQIDILEDQINNGVEKKIPQGV